MSRSAKKFKFYRKFSAKSLCLRLILPAVLLLAAFYAGKSLSFGGLETPTWRKEAYNGALIQGNTLPVLIHAKGGEGLQVNFDSPVKNISQLTLKGHIVKGKPSLQISGKAIGIFSVPLPEGRYTLWLPPDKNLALRIFSEEPFDYALEELVLNPAPDSLTEDQFKSYVLRQIPGLKEALDRGQKLDAAWLLLQWSARVSDLGSNMPPPSPGHFIYKMDAAQIYRNLWEKDAGGEACGGFALFYTKLLRLFGINAFLVETGFADKDTDKGAAPQNSALNYYFTHGTTVVTLPSEGVWRFYLFDPTSAGTFKDEENKFIDLATLLGHYDFERKRFDKNYWVAPPCFPRDVITHNSQGVITTIEKGKPYCVEDMVAGWAKRAHADGNPLAQQLDSYRADQNTNIFVDMLLSNIYSAGKNLDEDSVDEFKRMIAVEKLKSKL